MRNIIWLLAFALTACGGGSSQSAPESSITVQTYYRDSAIAYDLNVTNTNTTTVANTLTATTRSTDFTQLNINVDGYQPSWYPLASTENPSNVKVGLYRTASVNRKPNFTKGIIPHDAGGWLNSVYSGGYFPTTWDRIKTVVNGNTVVYADSAFVDTFDVIGGNVSFTGKFFPSDAVVIDMANMARTRNMELMMMVGIYPGDSFVQSFYQQIYSIPASNSRFWDAWFNAYKSILVDRARIANVAGVTHLAIGFNIDYMVDKGNARWADMISAIRATGFRGKISYFAGTYHEINAFTGMSDADKNSFIQLFDVIGLSVYDTIIPTRPSDLLSVTESINSMKTFYNYHLNSVRSANVPVMLMIGTPSIHGGTITTDYVEPGIPCLPSRITNYQQQADSYEAASEVINETTVNVSGLLSWGYAYNNNMKSWFSTNDSCMEQSASVRGKPAEAVLSYWFKNW